MNLDYKMRATLQERHLSKCMNPVLYLITNKRYRHAFAAVSAWSRDNVQNKTQVNVIEVPNINQI